MKFCVILVSLLAGVSANQGVRGVAPGDKHLYAPDSEGMFSCLSDPSIKIPINRVNDDYCDCPDGSDEPGTSACVNGRFWCEGAKQYIPSRLVNDGVCDYDMCCDGTDEAPGVCEDRCEIVKAKQAAEREARRAYLAEGSRLRAELVEQARSRKNELASSVVEFEARVPELENKLEAARRDLEAAEEFDATSGADEESVRALGEIREALHDADEVNTQFVDQFFALKDAYLELDAALDTMSTEYNPNFNDPAVKDAIRKWRAASKPGLSPPQGRDFRSDMDLIDKVKVAGSGSNSLRGLASLLPAPLRTLIFGKSVVGGASGPRAQAAQEQVDVLSSTLDEARNALKLHSKLLSLGSEFWGEDEVGRSSENTCVSKRKGDFDYEVCLFGTSVQLDGRHQVQLGRSTGLKKSETGEYSIDFIDGDVCPNGVHRSTQLLLQCGHSTEALSVDEPEMCHYAIRVSTPLACDGPQKEIVHDEL